MVHAYRIKVLKPMKCKRSEEETGSEDADYRVHDKEDEEKTGDAIGDMPGIPVMPPTDGSRKPNVIFILDKALLEIKNVGNKFSRKRTMGKKFNLASQHHIAQCRNALSKNVMSKQELSAVALNWSTAMLILPTPQHHKRNLS